MRLSPESRIDSSNTGLKHGEARYLCAYMASSPTDIRTLDIEGLKAVAVQLGQPAFRGKQIAEWLWTKGATRFEDMTNLPQAFRSSLASEYLLSPIRAEEEQVSRDGTVKCAFPHRNREGGGRGVDPRQGQDDGLHQQPGGL